MRVRVLSSAAANATTPELIEGEEVDLPDEPALKLVDDGKVEAVTPSDVVKVRQTVDERHAKAREQFEVSKASKEIAEEVHGKRPEDEEPEEADKHSGGTVDKKLAEVADKVAEKNAEVADKVAEKNADTDTKGK